MVRPSRMPVGLLVCRNRGPAGLSSSGRLRAVNPAIRWPVAGGSLGPRSRAACALRMSRREMLGERQVAAPLMAQRAAHRALRPAHRRVQPGKGVGVQLAGLRQGGKPQRPPQASSDTKRLYSRLHSAHRQPAPRPARAAGCPMRSCAPGRASVSPGWHCQMTRRSGAEHPVRHWLGEPCPHGSGARNGGSARVLSGVLPATRSDQLASADRAASSQRQALIAHTL